MKKFALIILAVVFCLPAFAKKQKNRKKTKSSNEIISVALRHTGCYGQCPDYTIEVNKNGIATYTATRFNLDSGVFTKKIGTTKAMEIICRFDTYRIDTCKDVYESRIPDLPGLVFTIVYRSKTKTIRDAKYGPSFLSLLARELDDLRSAKLDNSWKRTSDTAGK